MFHEMYFSAFDPLKNGKALLRSLFAPSNFRMSSLFLRRLVAPRRLVFSIEDDFIGDLLLL